jgi:hypothetical protein
MANVLVEGFGSGLRAQPASAAAARRPAWSGRMTAPLSHAVPDAWHPAALAGIKAIHTALFVVIAAAIGLFVWDGLAGRPRRRSLYALGVALAETAVYVSNNQVCPLTPVAEELGAERGSVVDMFLPAWAARRIPLVASVALLGGVVLNARAALGHRSVTPLNG